MGERMTGESHVLLHEAQDLTSNTIWDQKGFSVERFLDDAAYETFHRKTVELLFSCWRKAGLDVHDGFAPEQYHQLVPDMNAHLRAVDQTKLFSTSEFPVPIGLVENRIGEICGTSLRALNPYDQQSVFHFRVVRPSSGDNNPLHRDVWLEDYDNCINLYIPVAG